MSEITSNIAQKPFLLGSIVLLVLCSAIGLTFSESESQIGLVPVNTLIAKKYVWNIITSCFFETNAFKFVMDIGAIVTVTRLIKIPNTEQFGIYFGLNILACTLGTSAYCFIRFFATRLEEMLLTPVYGFTGIFICMLMFARQQRKSEPVHVLLPVITYNNLPVLVIFSQILCWSVGCHFVALDLPFTLLATFFSWSYLRFYFRFDDQQVQLGDKSDDFAFVAMFPIVR